MERLRVLRERAGLTQEQLARRADMCLANIRTWETGRNLPRIDRAAKLATALGVSLDVLAGLEPLPEGVADAAAK